MQVYYSSVSCGYSVSEAVAFAPSDWLLLGCKRYKVSVFFPPPPPPAFPSLLFFLFSFFSIGHFKVARVTGWFCAELQCGKGLSSFICFFEVAQEKGSKTSLHSTQHRPSLKVANTSPCLVITTCATWQASFKPYEVFIHSF